MPIYEYQCPECANIFEEWAKASEMKEVAPCPLCQTPSERIISHTAFVLKGGGWYVTDYGYRKNISEDAAAAPSASTNSSHATPSSTGTDAAQSPANDKSARAAPAAASPAQGTTDSAKGSTPPASPAVASSATKTAS